MKTNVTLSLDVDRINGIRSLAGRLGVPYSALVEQMITIASRHVTPAELRSWADGVQRSRSQPVVSTGPVLRKSELSALEALTSDWATLDEVRTKSLQGRGVCYRALAALQRHGLVEGEEGVTRHVGTDVPIRSRWRRATAGA